MGLISEGLISEKADLRGTDLYRAYLGGADLTGADLRGTNLSQAYLGGADLTGVLLRKANLYLANLTEAGLTGAYLGGANRTRAYYRGVEIIRAEIIGAEIIGANITEAKYDDETIFPEGFDPVEFGMRKVSEDEPQDPDNSATNTSPNMYKALEQ